MKLRHTARTDVGLKRDHNEDSYGVGEGEQIERLGELLVVCDGMGGHAAGEVASSMAVETILEHYYAANSDDRPATLAQAFEQANARIHASGRGSMGTTGVAALLFQDALHIANVGDSRAYLIRDGAIRQISRDHSFVSDQVAAGLITPEQARTSPHINVITRALGYQPEVVVDLFRLPLQVGDIIVLSSDGLHGLVSDEEITAIVTRASLLDEAADQLVALANERGGSDNITVIIAQVEALDWEATPLEDQVGEARERITLEFPTDEVPARLDEVPTERLQAPVTAKMVAAGAPAPAAVDSAAAVAAPGLAAPRQAPRERRLTLMGGLLATILLVVLIFVILFALNQPSSGQPTPAPTGLPALSGSPEPARTASPANTAVPASSTPQQSRTAAPAAIPTTTRATITPTDVLLLPPTRVVP